MNLKLAVLVSGSFLLGAIPFGYLIVRGAKGIDIRDLGSGNIGSTNVRRAASATQTTSSDFSEAPRTASTS